MQPSPAANGHDPAPDPWEKQRRHKRKPVLWSARIDTGMGAVECVILDLSLGGAKLRVIGKAPGRQRVTLTIDRFGPLEADVVWARSSHLGLRFTAPPDKVAQTIGAALPLQHR
jgi:hypothetical protein